MIEAVTICVNHSDFLAFTMPLNLHHFDRWIVITDFQDQKTVNLCNYYGIKCIQTDSMELHKHNFLKGKALNEGLALLDKKDWIIQIDADCALPPRFRHWIDWMDLDKSFIYGMDRIMFDNLDLWLDFYTNPVELLDGHLFPFKAIGGRLNRLQTSGYCVCGYFQMWNGETGKTHYPETWAGHFGEDVVFSSFWPRNKRALIPEMVVYHLASEPGQGNNWRGRKTPGFVSQIDRSGENNGDCNSNAYGNGSLVRR